MPQQILDGYSGVHAMEGIFAIAGHGVPAGVDLGERSIVDVAPTLLALLGRPVPSDSDGAVMAEALRDGVAVREGAGSYQERAADDEAALSAEEEATLERSLRDSRLPGVDVGIYVSSVDLRNLRPAREGPRPGGDFTWAATAAVGVTTVAMALVLGDGREFMAAAACIAFGVVFAIRPAYGVYAIVIARPSMDLWADRSLANVGSVSVNPASALALVFIAIGGAYVLENWSRAKQAPERGALHRAGHHGHPQRRRRALQGRGHHRDAAADLGGRAVPGGLHADPRPAVPEADDDRTAGLADRARRCWRCGSSTTAVRR